MGEWKEAYIDKKDSEPSHDYTGNREDHKKICWGVADRAGKCENIARKFSVYCDSCRQYFDSGEWLKKI